MPVSKKIRGHHLLCIQGFQGYGYSEEFVDNLQDIIESLDSCQDMSFEIVIECDDICSHCPHNIKGICQKLGDEGKHIRHLDELVIEKLGLLEGQKIKACDILPYVNTTLKRLQDIREICGECRWKHRCTWYISRQG